MYARVFNLSTLKLPCRFIQFALFHKSTACNGRRFTLTRRVTGPETDSADSPRNLTQSSPECYPEEFHAKAQIQPLG